MGAFDVTDLNLKGSCNTKFSSTILRCDVIKNIWLYLSITKEIVMKTIAINVPPNLADAFEKADIERKRTAELYINAWLVDFFGQQSANERLFEIMNKATAEAKAKGFSDAELQELLKSDE